MQLGRCIRGLAGQTRRPDRVVVVARHGDISSREVLEHSDLGLPIDVVLVERPGVVEALNRAIEQLDGDLVVFFDDDTVAHPSWIERAVGHLENDPRLVGVGGRDRLVRSPNPDAPSPRPVGKIDWWGRMNGFHHLRGQFGRVDVLKGCDMAYRREAVADLRFDERLRGDGAQVHNDAAFSLAASRRGGLLYDPDMVVDHDHGPRWDRDQRPTGPFHPVAWRHQAHNETVVLLDHLPPLRAVVYLAWSHLIGTRDNVGLVQAIRLTRTRGREAGRALLASQLGRIDGLVTWAGRR